MAVRLSDGSDARRRGLQPPAAGAHIRRAAGRQSSIGSRWTDARLRLDRHRRELARARVHELWRRPWRLGIELGPGAAVLHAQPRRRHAMGAAGRTRRSDADDRRTSIRGSTELPPGDGLHRTLRTKTDAIESAGIDLSRALGPSAEGHRLGRRATKATRSRIRAGCTRETDKSTIVQVTNLGVNVKYSPQNTLAFVTRLDTGEPVPGAHVSLITARWRRRVGKHDRRRRRGDRRSGAATQTGMVRAGARLHRRRREGRRPRLCRQLVARGHRAVGFRRRIRTRAKPIRFSADRSSPIAACIGSAKKFTSRRFCDRIRRRASGCCPRAPRSTWRYATARTERSTNARSRSASGAARNGRSSLPADGALGHLSHQGDRAMSSRVREARRTTKRWCRPSVERFSSPLTGAPISVSMRR